MNPFTIIFYIIVAIASYACGQSAFRTVFKNAQLSEFEMDKLANLFSVLLAIGGVSGTIAILSR